jgi:hypothetical protein
MCAPCFQVAGIWNSAASLDASSTETRPLTRRRCTPPQTRTLKFPQCPAAEAAEALKDAWLNNAAIDAPQLLVKDVACYGGW